MCLSAGKSDEAANACMESDEDELSCHIHDVSGDYAYFTAPSNDRDGGFRGKLHAIADMPSPKDITNVRRFLGMITYLGKFIPSLSQSTEPLRQLAKREPFQVDNKLHIAFNTAKERAVSALAELAFFQTDTSIPTAISCDASPLGLGAVLWQADNSNQWLPVSCASRSLTDTESRYSQIEREMLGVVFALNRFRQYVLGRHVMLFSHPVGTEGF